MTTKYEATNNLSSSDDLKLATTKYKKPAFLYVLIFLSTIGGFLFGYDTGVVSGAMLLIKHEFQLTTAWHEAIVSATIAAAWLFALIGGWLSERFGRKPVILLASLVFTIGSLVMGLAPGKEVLLVGRIIVGVGIGLASMSVPVFIAESALSEDRGLLVTLNTIAITGGQFIASAVCGVFSTQDNGWRFMLGLAVIPAVIQFVGFLGMPESPRWLVSHGRQDEALKVLRSIRGREYPAERELEAVDSACAREREARTGSAWLQVLRTPSTRRALTLGCLLQMFQQIAGINTVMYYSASIIQMAGISDFSVAIWLSCLTAGINFFCTFIGLFLVDRVGRRPLTLGSLTGVFFALIILGVSFHLMGMDSPPISIPGDASCGFAATCADCIASAADCGFCYLELANGTTADGSCVAQNPNVIGLFPTSGACSNRTAVGPATGLTWAVGWCPSSYSWIAVTALCIYLLFFAPGMGPMPWTINSEIYPMWARSFCNSVATSTNWMFNLIISMTFLTLTELLTKEGTFYLYAGFAGVGLVVFIFILPETKGRSLEEMETLFSGSLCSRPGRNSKNVQYVHIRGLNRDGWEQGDDSGESDS